MMMLLTFELDVCVFWGCERKKLEGGGRYRFFFGWSLKVDFWLVGWFLTKGKKGETSRNYCICYPNWLEMVRESQRSTQKNHPFLTGRCCCGNFGFQSFCSLLLFSMAFLAFRW